MISYVFGMPGSGGTEYLYEEIKENISIGNNSFILVPEQYSLFTERQMLDTLGFEAQRYVQTLTFSRLSNMVLSALGPLRMKYIDSAGKNMLAARAVQMSEERLEFFRKNVNQKGFSSLLVSLFEEFKRYGVTAEGLSLVLEKIKNEDLYRKLSEILILYSKYNELLNEKNSDAEDNLAIIIPKLSKCGFLNGNLYINHFKSFTPLEYGAIYELMRKMDVTVIFVSDDIEKTNGAFRSAGITYKKLNEFAKENSIEKGKNIYLDSDKKHIESKELAHLKKNYLSYSPKEFSEKCENIHLIRPRTYFDEVEAAARHILNLCRTKGYTFEDFLVLTADSEIYKDIIPVVFEKYEISFFMDTKSVLSEHIFIRFITCVLEILSRGFSYERIMTTIRTGFFSLEKKEEDIFENYLLASGMADRHYQTSSDYTKNPDEKRYDMALINSVKKRSINLILELEKSIKGRKTAGQITDALYTWLEKSGIKDDFARKIDSMLDENKADFAKELETVWNMLMAIFSQIDEMFGESFITYEKFYEIFTVAAGSAKIGAVPTFINQVHVTDRDKFASKDAKVVMVLGVMEGTFPKSFPEDGIISDAERKEIEEAGMLLAPTAYDKQYDEQLAVFSVLTSPKNQLWLSSPLLNSEGEAIDSGEVFDSIKKLFPDIKEEYTEFSEEEIFLEGRKAAFDMLLNEICEKGGNIEDLSDFWRKVYEYFKDKDGFSLRIKRLICSLETKETELKLSREMAAQLYGKNMLLSVSRMEKYNACAFSYFLTYGLFAEERQKAQFQPNDIGTALHDVLCKYFERRKKENADYSKISYRDVKEETEKIVEESETLKASALYETSTYYRYVLLRIKHVAATTAWKIVRFYANSDFRPYGFEIKIGTDGLFPPYTIVLKDSEVKIRGFIDRMDIAEIDGKKYFNIVDYKSSEKKIDLELASLGVRFQPLLYAGIVKENIENSNPSAMLYMHMNDPVVNFSSKPEWGELEKAVMGEVKVEGLVLDEEEVTKKLDYSFGEKGKVNYVPSSKGSMVDEDKMEELLNQAIETAKETAEKIADGNIDINPVVMSKFDACQYCSFSNCCQMKKEISGKEEE